MANILVLDDAEERLRQFRAGLTGHTVDTAMTSKEAIALITKNDYNIIFLDHDLGGKAFVSSGEDTGYEVAEFLSQNPQRLKGRVVVHSLNPSGAKNMCAVLPAAIRVPGAWVKLDTLFTKETLVSDNKKVYKDCGRQNPKVVNVIHAFPEPTKILVVFWHGLGDLLMFQPVYHALCRKFPQHYFTLGLLPGVGHSDILPDGKEIPEKDFLKDHDAAFVISFPMVEGSHTMTKAEYCVATEIGDAGYTEPLVSWGKSLTVPFVRNRMVGVHFQGTCLPGSTNPDDALAHRIWDDIVGAGYIPMDLHMEHVFHNPVNACFPWATRHLRDVRDPALSTLYALLTRCFAVVGVASGPFVLSVCSWPEKTIFLQKYHKIGCYLKDFGNVVDLLKYDKNVLITMLHKIYKNQDVL